jgi:signal peptidase I, bacterial type
MKLARSTTVLFFTVILAALAVKLCVLDILRVSGPSMFPSLEQGSILVEFKLAWGIPVPFSNRYLVRWGGPASGDVVIYPWQDRWVVKRCIATAGTPLVFSSETGYSVETGGRTIPLSEEQYQKLKQADRVPEGMIFALGDNMAESRDSRDYGFVSLDSIRGKVLWK